MLVLQTLLALSASCVSTRLPPMSAAGANFRPLLDEMALWSESQVEEEALVAGVRLEDDPDLVADRLGARLTIFHGRGGSDGGGGGGGGGGTETSLLSTGMGGGTATVSV